jgi:hypothetical protein
VQGKGKQMTWWLVGEKEGVEENSLLNHGLL